MILSEHETSFLGTGQHSIKLQLRSSQNKKSAISKTEVFLSVSLPHHHASLPMPFESVNSEETPQLIRCTTTSDRASRFAGSPSDRVVLEPLLMRRSLADVLATTTTTTQLQQSMRVKKKDEAAEVDVAVVRMAAVGAAAAAAAAAVERWEPAVSR